MKNGLWLSLFLAFQPLLNGMEATVGGVKLQVPVPEGCARITDEMLPYAEIAKRFVPPANEQLALFLPQGEVLLAARGEIPRARFSFVVQCEKALVEKFISNADFARLKKTVKSQNEEALRNAAKRLPGLLEKAKKSISNDYKVDVDLEMDQMVPFPPHYETDRVLSYSAVLKGRINDETGKLVPFEGVVTAAFVHIQGKLLFLYGNAERADLERCRSESRKWVDMFVAANPSTGEIAARESRSGGSGFNWTRVLGSSIVGGIIGGIVGLVRYLSRRRNG